MISKRNFSNEIQAIERKSIDLLDSISKNSYPPHVLQQKFNALTSEFSELGKFANAEHISVIHYWEQYSAINENFDSIHSALKDKEGNQSFTNVSPPRKSPPMKTYSSVEDFIKEILESFPPDIAKFSKDRHDQGYGVFITNKVYSAFEEKVEWGRYYSELKRTKGMEDLFMEIELNVYILTGLVSPGTKSLYG